MSQYELNKLPKDDQPTILVLGSEGSRLACTEFVRIPGGSDKPVDKEDASGVDLVRPSSDCIAH